jgi:hypothetical protein
VNVSSKFNTDLSLDLKEVGTPQYHKRLMLLKVINLSCNVLEVILNKWNGPPFFKRTSPGSSIYRGVSKNGKKWQVFLYFSFLKRQLLSKMMARKNTTGLLRRKN